MQVRPKGEAAFPATKPVVLTIVIPVFNEEENVDAVIAEVEATISAIPERSEVIIVDDGSTDRTWERISANSVTRPWLRALRFLGHRGQTAAMVAGIDAARGEVIGFLDGDLQNNPADVPRMLELIATNECDVVCGWREQRHDEIDRTIASRLANSVLRRIFKLDIHDFGCTLKLFRRPYLQDVHLYGEMHRFIACYAQAQGARIRELKVDHRPRRAGRSKYGMQRAGKVIVDALTVKLLNSYGSSPAYFFGKIAFLFFVLGTVAFSIVAYRTFALGRPQSTPMVFMMLLTYVTSLLCLTSGLLAEICIRILHSVGGGRAYRVIEELGGEGAVAGRCAEFTE